MAQIGKTWSIRKICWQFFGLKHAITPNNILQSKYGVEGALLFKVNRYFRATPYCFGTPINEFLHKKSIQNEKSKKVSKYASLAQGVVKAGGGSPDPKVNKVLAEFLVKCQKEGISKNMILNSVSTKTLDKEVIFFLTGNNLATIIGCKTSNLKLAHSFMNHALKKSMFNANIRDPNQINSHFDRKGVVIISQPLEDGKILTEEECTELALDVEAEDVVQSEGEIKFICSDKSWKQMEKCLIEKKMSLLYTNTEYIPKQPTQLEEDIEETYQLFYKLLQRQETVAEKLCHFYEIATSIQ